MSYKMQELDFEFHLVNENDTFSDGSIIKKLYSPRSMANIKSFGGHSSGEAKFLIWGLSLEDIATLTRFYGWSTRTKSINQGANKNKRDMFNLITVRSNGSTVYQGMIVSCLADLNLAPEAPVSIYCNPCPFLMTYVSKPFSFNGDIKASDMIEAIIKPFNMSLTNIDVTASLTNPYIVGSPYQQIMQIANHVGCFVNYSYDDIYISSQKAPRDNQEIILSPETGLIGYPMYYKSHLVVKTYYSPSYALGKKIKLTTLLPLASGDYFIESIIHDLSCNLPNGKFETTLVLIRDFKNEKSS